MSCGSDNMHYVRYLNKYAPKKTADGLSVVRSFLLTIQKPPETADPPIGGPVAIIYRGIESAE